MIPTQEKLVHVKKVTRSEDSVEVEYVELRTGASFRQPFSLVNGGAPKLGTDAFIRVDHQGQVIYPPRRVDLGRLYEVAKNEPLAVSVTMIEPHPDGGWTPAKGADKGELTAVCPACSEVLMRHTTERALAMTSIQCPSCKRRVVGADHPHRGQRPGDAGSDLSSGHPFG